jgi:putative transposase
VQVWHRNFPELLNVAVIVKTNLKTGRTAKMLLFSDDLALAVETLIQYYSLT